MNFTLPGYITAVISRLNSHGYEAYVVGGCVRDMLRGVTPNDYDMTTSALPDETAAAFSDHTVIKTGIKHGTVTVLAPDSESGKRQPVEITTYRVDGSYTDNRHPESVTFTASLNEDLCRRDFTVNAMAYSPEGGLVDIFGGRDDIGARIIRCVGDPYRRFDEDGLRILRALRFAATLDYTIEAGTSSAIHDLRGLLENISYERIYVELNKLLCGTGATRILTAYRDVFETVLPEIAALSDKAYSDAVNAVSKAPADRLTRYACLLADLGADDAHRAMRRLKCDNASVNTVTALCRSYADPAPENEAQIKRMCAGLGYENARRLCDLRCAYGDETASDIRKTIEAYESRNECISLKQLSINGGTLQSLGISGKDIGRMLEALLDMVITGKIENEADALTEQAKKILPKLP